jgi:tripartite-type tricarboxylate transporter receptor subunit TctC
MKTLRALAAVAAAIVFTQHADAQDWPNRPLTMVAPFATGGSTDAIARIVAEGLSAQLHQPVIVENIGGAGGMTGANRVAKAAPDGYSFVLGNVGTHAQNQTLYKVPLYNAVTDFAPVGLIMDQSLILVTRKDLPPNNLQEFIAYAAEPGEDCNSARAVSAAPITWPACCSTRRSASTSRTCPIAAADRRCRTCWPVGSIISARARRP